MSGDAMVPSIEYDLIFFVFGVGAHTLRVQGPK